MSKLLLMPTPNWFTSRSLDVHHETGTIAMSFMNSILIMSDLFEKFNFTLKDSHSKRINCICFLNQNYLNESSSSSSTLFLASCSEDLEVKVWNLIIGDNNKCILLASHKHHQNIPTSLDWIIDENFLLSGDNKGNLFKFNHSTKSHARYFPENKPITQLKTSNHNFFIVAIG